MPYRRTYITVIARHGPDGTITPLSIVWQDRTYTIYRISNICRRASTKAGGAGMRYTCWIEGKARHLYHEDVSPHAWFVEERIESD